MAAKTKKVSVTLIEPESDAGRAMYPMINRLIEAHHEELTQARIALAWNLSWKPDADGRMKLGQCRRATDLDRELHRFDFVIILNQAFWQDAEVTDAQREALMDHELCHAMPKYDDETGEHVYDAKGRPVWRMRKHDIEEFACIVRRYGTYKADLEQFYAEATRGRMAQQMGIEEAIARVGTDGVTVRASRGSGSQGREYEPETIQ